MQSSDETFEHNADDDRISSRPAAEPLDAVLQAFQSLQMKHSHVLSSVSHSLDIGATDLRALIFIASTGGVTPKQTGDFLELSSGAITNLVDRMSTAGFVRREPNPKDRRSLLIHISPSGVAAVDEILGLYRQTFTGSVKAEDLLSLAAAFDAIGDSLTSSAREKYHPDGA